jgi:flagellar hook-associated protein FlgK
MREPIWNGADTARRRQSALHLHQPTQVAGSAASMSVVMTDPNQIAAAGAGDGTGDNSNAIAMANLAKQSIVNGQTPTNYYSNFVSRWVRRSPMCKRRIRRRVPR